MMKALYWQRWRLLWRATSVHKISSVPTRSLKCLSSAKSVKGLQTTQQKNPYGTQYQVEPATSEASGSGERLYLGDSALKREIGKFDPDIPVESARTPPSSWYHWLEFDRLDRETVFANNWIAVERWDALKQPGDFVTGMLGDEPYIISRGQDGELRAFYNVCRHHATLVEERSCGKTDCFTCPYHGWTYGLDGRLLKATKLKGIKDFKAKDYGLRPIGVCEWGTLIFINMADGPHTILTERLRHLLSDMEAFGDPRDMVHMARRHYTIDCNWKVFVDNYLDGGYHVPFAHKALAELLELKSYKTEVFDGYSIQSSGGEGDYARGTDRVGHEVLYAHVYPNVMLNRYGPWLDINYTFPVSPERCNVMFDWYLERERHDNMAPEDIEKLVADNLEESETVQREDIEICERVQKGLRSRGYEWGRYSPNVEHADHDFHLRVFKDYQSRL